MINLIKKKGINPQTGQVIYFPQFTRKETINGQKLATRMARGGSFSLGECTGVLLDFPQYFVDELLDGNAVKIDGLGVFKLKVSGKSRAKIEDVTSAGATVQVIYEPDPALDARKENQRLQDKLRRIQAIIDEDRQNGIAKAEQFIRDYTKRCSNELTDGSYHEWLTPDQARRAVEIALEEMKE